MGSQEKKKSEILEEPSFAFGNSKIVDYADLHKKYVPYWSTSTTSAEYKPAVTYTLSNLNTNQK